MGCARYIENPLYKQASKKMRYCLSGSTAFAHKLVFCLQKTELKDLYIRRSANEDIRDLLFSEFKVESEHIRNG